MRLFYFLLFIPALSLAAPPVCDETDLVASSVGCTSLTIDNAINLVGAGGAVIDIVVNGDVNISANILMDGANGVLMTVDNTAGVNGGPGAFSGGGISGNTAEVGLVPPEGGFQGQQDGPCSSGGGGGASQVTNGNDGLVCTGGTLIGAAGTTASSFPGIISGGNGGGAGGEKNIGVFDLGGGGGGGGGIRIRAQAGTITIANGVQISAKGGNGGNSVNIGGAGGGGGGGTIHLIGDVAVVNQGILDVTGGSGGIATRAVTPRGGNGGAGGNGIIRIEDGVNPPQDFSGRQDFSTGGPLGSSRSSLSSDISCGTVAKKNNDSMTFQVMIGFMLVLLARFIFSMRKRFAVWVH